MDFFLGANIVVGNKAPLSGFINVVGYAASVMLNDRTSATVTIPGIAITKDEKSVIIINADESVKTALSSSGSAIYGENHLTLSSTCVSTLWNGKIVAKQGSNVSSAALHCSDSAIICEKPDNASWPSKSLVFYNPTFAGDFDKKAALAELLKLTDGKKENILAELVDNNTVVVIRSVSELKKLL